MILLGASDRAMDGIPGEASENLYRAQFAGWAIRSMLYPLATWVNGLAFKNIQFSPTGEPVIKIAEIKGGISSQTKFTEQSFDDSVHVEAGDLLFAWSGQPETSIDAYRWKGPEGWLNQHIFKVTPSSVVDDEFFYYLLKYLRPTFVAIARNKQTTGLGHVTRRDLENLEVALPSLSEQRRIADILGALDDKIELNRRMNETLEQMACALYKSWFVDFDPVCAKMEGRWQRGESLPGLPAELYDLFPDRLVPSTLGEIPDRWWVSCFGDLAEVVGGGTPSTKEPAYWTNGTHRFATPKDLSGLSVPILLDTERRITEEGLGRISSGLLPAGVVLMSSRAPIGYLAIAQNPLAVNQGFIAMQAKSGVSNLFLLYCTKFSQDEIISRANGSTFLEISKTNFRPIPILMPDDAIMAEFDAVTKPLITRIVQNCCEIRTLGAQLDALLPRLMSGALRVSEANVTEPA